MLNDAGCEATWTVVTMTLAADSPWEVAAMSAEPVFVEVVKLTCTKL